MYSALWQHLHRLLIKKKVKPSPFTKCRAAVLTMASCVCLSKAEIWKESWCNLNICKLPFNAVVRYLFILELLSTRACRVASHLLSCIQVVLHLNLHAIKEPSVVVFLLLTSCSPELCSGEVSLASFLT